MRRLAKYSALVSCALALAGCSGSNPCSEKAGSVSCGYCDEDVVLSSNPHAGKCRYCPAGTACNGPVCGEISCGPAAPPPAGGEDAGECKTCACPEYSSCEACGGGECKNDLCAPKVWCCPGGCDIFGCGCL